MCMCVCVSVRLLCLLSPQRMLAKRSGEGFPTHLKRIEVCLHASPRAGCLFFPIPHPPPTARQGDGEKQAEAIVAKSSTARTRVRLTLFALFFSAFLAAPSSFPPLPVAISALPVPLASATVSGAKVRGRREQVRQCWRGAARLLGYLCLSCCHSGKERAHFVLLFSAPMTRFVFFCFFFIAKLLRLAATIFMK